MFPVSGPSVIQEINRGRVEGGLCCEREDAAATQEAVTSGELTRVSC